MVADHRRLVRLRAELCERLAEDGGVRLDLAVVAGGDGHVGVQAVVADELAEVARAVRDEADLEPVPAQLFEHRLDVLVDVEVVGVLPRMLDLLGDRPRRRRVSAHADDDSLRELDPELLVMAEVRMLLQRLERSRPRLVVPRDVELDPVTAPDAEVSLGPELGAGTGEGEVDVEEDGFERRGREIPSPGPLVRLRRTGRFATATCTPRAASTRAREDFAAPAPTRSRSRSA